MGSRDPNPKSNTTIQSYPTGETDVAVGSTPITAGSSLTFVTTVFPYGNILSLWNFFWNIFIDFDDPTYDYFGGVNVTLAMKTKIFVMTNDNWANSSDRNNKRVMCVRVVNNDTVDHTFYFKFKAYTVTGTGNNIV